MRKKVFMICGIILGIIICCILFFLISSKTINFLTANKKSLEIDNENITDDNDYLSDEYDSNTGEKNEEGAIYKKEFGSYEILNGWVENKEHSTKNKFFYILEGTENEKIPNNISINVGKNKYAASEHEKFRKAIINQLSFQIANNKDTTLNANGSHTDNGYVVYTFIINESKENITTKQYYIVGDYKYVLIQETTNGESNETDTVAKKMVNSFQWADSNE